jgi:hypothetical protein
MAVTTSPDGVLWVSFSNYSLSDIIRAFLHCSECLQWGPVENHPTNSTEQSPWQANISSTSQESSILQKRKVHYRVQKSPPLVSTMSHINPVHILPSYFFKPCFNIILTSTRSLPEFYNLYVLKKTNLSLQLGTLKINLYLTVIVYFGILALLITTECFPLSYNAKFVEPCD